MRFEPTDQAGERNPANAVAYFARRAALRCAWVDMHREEFESAPMCEAPTKTMRGYLFSVSAAPYVGLPVINLRP